MNNVTYISDLLMSVLKGIISYDQVDKRGMTMFICILCINKIYCVCFFPSLFVLDTFVYCLLAFQII